jgi:hypothetical protein
VADEDKPKLKRKLDQFIWENAPGNWTLGNLRETADVFYGHLSLSKPTATMVEDIKWPTASTEPE